MPMAMWLRFGCFLATLVAAGRNGGNGGYRNSRPPLERPQPVGMQPQVVRLEVQVRDEHSKGSGSRRDDHRRRSYRQGRNDRRPEDSGHYDRAPASKDKKKKKKKRSTSSSSSSSSSSSVVKPKPSKKHKKKSTGAPQYEDKVVEEIRKLRDSLKPCATTPTTPSKTGNQSQAHLTPKSKSHLKTLLSFMQDGELQHLADMAQAVSWEDIEEQLQSQSLPSLKAYLGTRLPSSEIPARKPAAVSKVMQLAKRALPR